MGERPADRLRARVVRLTFDAARPGVVRLTVEPDRRLLISAELARHLDLQTGTDLTPDQLDAVTADADRIEARERAYTFLRRRARSETEIRRHLATAGHGEEAVAFAVDSLRRLGLIDDAAFAREWVRSRVETRGFGPLRILHELREKGVDRTIAQASVDQMLDAADVRAEAMRLARRQWSRYRGLSPERAQRRMRGYLMRRGYPASVVAQVMVQLGEVSGVDTGDDGFVQ